MWQETYKRKVISTEEAVGKIKSRDDVIVAQCASEPQGCMSKFHLVKDAVEDVKVFSVLTLKTHDFYAKPDMKGHFELWYLVRMDEISHPGIRESPRHQIGGRSRWDSTAWAATGSESTSVHGAGNRAGSGSTS